MYRFKKAYLEITNVCNLSCVFCPGTRRTPGFLSPEGFHLLAGRLRPHTEYLYLHLMGEPLLHPQLGELLAGAAQLGFKVVVTTNATLLAGQADLLCASPAVEKISLSLHAWEGNVRADLEGYLAVCLTFAHRAAAAGKRCALRLWNLDGATAPGANDWNRAILNQLEASFPRPWAAHWQGTTLAPGVYLELGERFDWPDLAGQANGEAGFCRGLRDQVGVLWDGTVVPCCLDCNGDIALGSLYHQTLEEILDTPRARALYNGFSQGRVTEQLCRSCGFLRKQQ